MRRLATLCQLIGVAGIIIGLFYAHDVINHPPEAHTRDQLMNCYNNLQSIGLAFKTWALDHHDKFPFSLSTNLGGTMELSASPAGDFDQNAQVHFRIMSNELSTPAVLVCPNDPKTKPCSTFDSLRPENITYHLRSGPSVNDTNLLEILAVCPVDGNILHCDGSTSFALERGTGRPPLAFLWHQNESFRQASRQVLCSLAASVLLLLVGTILKRTQSSTRTASPPSADTKP
jgi:hypothetical protein